MLTEKRKKHLEKLREINKKRKTGKFLKCKNCGKKFYVFNSRLRQANVKFCNIKCYSRKGKNNNQYGKKREKSPCWKGGIRKQNGYRIILLFDGSIIYEHRLIVENFLKRKLKKTEHIHHINGIKSDNRLINLYLFTKAQHKAFHNKKRKPKLTSNILSSI